MFKEIFLFEFNYRKNRPATYIYFLIVFLFCFLTATSPKKTETGQIFANAGYVISLLLIILSFAFTMITSAIMGVAVVRDFDHNMDTVMFSTRMTKGGYLFGRFWGSFVVLILINCGTWLGLMTGFAVGRYMPWEVSWAHQAIAPFHFWTYIGPFLLFTLPNLFITGSLFFLAGALSRKPIVIYLQGILLVILYQISNGYLRDMDSRVTAALIDPFGIQAFTFVTRYWTPVEQNSLLAPAAGMVLYNRLIWMAAAAGALIFTYFWFSFSRQARQERAKKTAVELRPHELKPIPVPKTVARGRKLFAKQTFDGALLYFRMMVQEIPFIAILAGGFLLLLVNATKIGGQYGTNSYPTSNSILTLLESFNLILLTLAIFYSGELIWKERSLNVNLILDALPVPSGVTLAAKFVAMLMTYAVLLLALALFGACVQAAYGYYQFDLPLYAGTLFSTTFLSLAVFTVLAFCIQVLVNNKFLGFVLCVIFFIVNGNLPQLGVENDLWQFGSGTLSNLYSDMNHYGHFLEGFTWLKIYWLAFTGILFIIGVIFFARGAEDQFRMRWKTGKLRVTRALVVFGSCALALFVFSGSYIYYNSFILNEFQSSAERQAWQAAYEKELKRFERTVQPKITEVNMEVDLFPSTRAFRASGFYYLRNDSRDTIRDIHVQQNTDSQLGLRELTFEPAATVKEQFPAYRYTVYQLTKPLAPGDSLKFRFSIAFTTPGFEEKNSNTDIVFNGTFLNNSYFPSFGYDNRLELSDDTDRKKHGLAPKERMADPGDPLSRASNLYGDDADRVRFQMTVSTDSSQVAVAPGYLEKQWNEGKRRYFHYVMDKPIANFYSIVSGRYTVRRDTWNGVNLEIYYHPGHPYNIDRMMQGMKDALAYCSDNFGPYQYRQLRIIEFPRYANFAQSFANTICFSEGIGFILKISKPDRDLDVPYYVAAHETAHQWWGHQVMEARVRGNAMLSEGMSQYSALMVMKHSFPPEVIERYLKYELDAYLSGRARERQKERPLESVEYQPYIHYNKSSLVFYALQDYIGEDSLNAAFRRYNSRWKFKPHAYPVAADLVDEIYQVTPDSLRFLVHDLFETITLFENKMTDAVYRDAGKNKYEVTLVFTAEKFRADSAGFETHVPVADWIDIGIYGKAPGDKEKLIYLKKHKITTKDNTLRIMVDQFPTRAGIDPLHKLIDRHSNDNVVGVTSFFGITNIPIEF